MPRRPVIGIVSRNVPFYHNSRPYPRYGVAISYCKAVEMAGGLPIILSMTQEKLVLEGSYQERAIGLPSEHGAGSLVYKPPAEPHSNRFTTPARTLLVQFPGRDSKRESLDAPLFDLLCLQLFTPLLITTAQDDSFLRHLFAFFWQHSNRLFCLISCPQNLSFLALKLAKKVYNY